MATFEKHSLILTKFIMENNITSNINLEDHSVIKTISSALSSTYQKTFEFKQSSETFIPKISEEDHYPKLYIFLYKLNKQGILNNPRFIPKSYSAQVNELIKVLPNYDDFKYWYENANTDVISSIMDSIGDCNDAEMSKVKSFCKDFDDELKSMYGKLFSEDRNDLSRLLYIKNKFVSLNTQHNIETIDLYKIEYMSKSDQITIYTPDKKKMPNINYLLHILAMFRKLYPENTKKPINLTIIGTEMLKHFGNHVTPILTNEDINSGMTDEGLIYIWRMEEVYKVFIHELIHVYSIDNFKHSDDVDEFVSNTFNIKGSDFSNEACTEALAVILHTNFVAYHTQCEFSTLIRLEESFTSFQIAKIIEYFGFDSIDAIMSKNGKTNKIKQTTSVVSYFIVKGILISNLTLFLNLLERGKLKYANNEDVVKLLEKNISNIDNFDTYMKVLKSTKDKFIRNTLRMTCLQII